MSEQASTSANGHPPPEVVPPIEGQGNKTEPTEEIEAAIKQIQEEQQQQQLNAQASHETLPDDKPKTEFEQLLDSLKDDPHQPEKWQRVVDIAEESGDTDKIKAAYEGVLETYPNTVRILSASSCLFSSSAPQSSFFRPHHTLRVRSSVRFLCDAQPRWMAHHRQCPSLRPGVNMRSPFEYMFIVLHLHWRPCRPLDPPHRHRTRHRRPITPIHPSSLHPRISR